MVLSRPISKISSTRLRVNNPEIRNPSQTCAEGRKGSVMKHLKEQQYQQKWLDWYVFSVLCDWSQFSEYSWGTGFSLCKSFFCVFVSVGSVKNQKHLSIRLEFLMSCGTFTNCVAEWNNSSNSSFPTRDCISFSKSTLLSHKASLLPRNSENSLWQCPQHLKQPGLKFCLSAELPFSVQRTENPPLNL